MTHEAQSAGEAPRMTMAAATQRSPRLRPLLQMRLNNHVLSPVPRTEVREQKQHLCKVNQRYLACCSLAARGCPGFCNLLSVRTAHLVPKGLPTPQVFLGHALVCPHIQQVSWLTSVITGTASALAEILFNVMGTDGKQANLKQHI